jgi:hypothetical protein
MRVGDYLLLHGDNIRVGDYIASVTVLGKIVDDWRTTGYTTTSSLASGLEDRLTLQEKRSDHYT